MGYLRRVYREELSSSVINWSLVVITRLDALNPVEEMIRLMNSCDRSTLLSPSAPDRICPAPSASGDVIIAAPLFAPAANWFPPWSTSPVGLLNIATATRPSVRVRPLLNEPVIVPSA